MAVANSVSGALGDLDAGQDAWVNTCVNGIGERAGNADLLSCILAFRYGFGVGEAVAIGDQVDLSWARRFGLWAAYAFGQPLPPAWPGVGRNAFAHESGIHADGALKDRANYELYDDATLGPFPAGLVHPAGPGRDDRRVRRQGRLPARAGRARHRGRRRATENLVFSLVQLCASATGKPLTDDELRLIAGYPRQLALLFPGQLTRQLILVRSLSVRRAICRPDRSGGHVGPVAVGVMLAFGWNLAAPTAARGRGRAG